MVIAAADQALIAPVAVDATSAEVVGYLIGLLGVQVTAVIAGTEDGDAVLAWSSGNGAPDAPADRRLRAAFAMARLIEQEESLVAARSWMIGRSPYLGDRSPALVLADDAELGEDRAIRAAYAYLAHG